MRDRPFHRTEPEAEIIPRMRGAGIEGEDGSGHTHAAGEGGGKGRGIGEARAASAIVHAESASAEAGADHDLINAIARDDESAGSGDDGHLLRRSRGFV